MTRPASVDTHAKRGDGEAGSVRRMGSAVPAEQGDAQTPVITAWEVGEQSASKPLNKWGSASIERVRIEPTRTKLIHLGAASRNPLSSASPIEPASGLAATRINRAQGECAYCGTTLHCGCDEYLSSSPTKEAGACQASR